MKRLLAVTALALLFCGASFAQQSSTSTSDLAGAAYKLAVAQQAGFVNVNRVVKNAPYSAKQVHETTQTLADGTHIATTSTVTHYRDSSGRTRTEVNDEIATINDPVGGAIYRLNMKAQTASTIRIMRDNISIDESKADLDKIQAELQADVQAKLAAAQDKIAAVMPQAATGTISTTNGTLTITPDGRGGSALPNNGEFTTESLGTQTMEGLVVEGTRMTHTIAAGDIGNDRPIQVVTERWYSSELQLYVMTKTTDPRYGETVTRYTELQRGEPDASLFQIPANYKIVGGVGGRGGRGQQEQ